MGIERDPETYSIIGAAMAVHRELGAGFLENVYQCALAVEFADKNIPFQSEADIPVSYRGRKLDVSYRADFVCFDNVIVELKALGNIGGNEKSQVLNYLKATNYERALLINFGTPSLQHERVILTKTQSA